VPADLHALHTCGLMYRSSRNFFASLLDCRTRADGLVALISLRLYLVPASKHMVSIVGPEHARSAPRGLLNGGYVLVEFTRGLTVAHIPDGTFSIFVGAE
jgi:hypothetical protein